MSTFLPSATNTLLQQADNPLPGKQTPLAGRHPPGRQPPPTPRPSRRLLQQTVRLLLECILVTPVCDSVHKRSVYPSMQWGRHPLPRYCRIRSTSGRYASYWNVFLLRIKLLVVSGIQCTYKLDGVIVKESFSPFPLCCFRLRLPSWFVTVSPWRVSL